MLRTLVIAVILQSTMHAQKIIGISAITANGEVRLESVNGVQKATESNFVGCGFAGTCKIEVLTVIPNDRSPVRLRASDVQGFLVSSQPSASAEMNAAELSATELRFLVVKKNKERQFVSMVSKSTLFVPGGADPSPKVSVSIVAVDDHTVKIVPKVLPLLPGEYAFRGGAIQEVQTTQRYEKTKKIDKKDQGHFQMYGFAIE